CLRSHVIRARADWARGCRRLNLPLDSRFSSATLGGKGRVTMALLSGKAIVITGSGRGIGEACIKGAARQGSVVVVNDVDAGLAEKVAADIRAAGGTAIACAADITDWDQAGRLIDTCIGEYGRIDGLVNNAGLF